MAKLVGCETITSKKSGETFSRLHFLIDGGKNCVGAATLTEFTSFNADYSALVGQDVNIIYGKAYDGRAYVDHLEVC